MVTRPDLFAPAIARAGLAPDRVIHVEAGDKKALLACFEEGLRHGGLGAVVAEAARLSMTASSRLQLAPMLPTPSAWLCGGGAGRPKPGISGSRRPASAASGFPSCRRGSCRRPALAGPADWSNASDAAPENAQILKWRGVKTPVVSLFLPRWPRIASEGNRATHRLRVMRRARCQSRLGVRIGTAIMQWSLR